MVYAFPDSHSIFIFYHILAWKTTILYKLYDARVPSLKIRRKRIFELGTRQKHEKAARTGRLWTADSGDK